MSKNQPNDDRVIWRKNIPAEMGVHSNTIRVWIKNGKFPKPDVYMTQKMYGWRLSTLRQHGINLA